MSKEAVDRVRRLQIATYHLAEEMMAGLYHSAFKGRGMEFEEVREYQPGDEIRHIDWNVTARLQHPYTKLFGEEREIALWLLVDISPSMNSGSHSLLKREYAAETAALLSFAAVKNHDSVGLILFSDQVEYLLPPMRNTQQAMRIVHETSTRMPLGKGSDLSCALHKLGHLQKRRAICFFISDFLYVTPKTSLELISKRHDLIAIMIGTPHEKKFPLNELFTAKESESGAELSIDGSMLPATMPLSHFWAEQKRIFNASSIDYIELSTQQSSFFYLKKFFQSRARSKMR